MHLIEKYPRSYSRTMASYAFVSWLTYQMHITCRYTSWYLVVKVSRSFCQIFGCIRQLHAFSVSTEVFFIMRSNTSEDAAHKHDVRESLVLSFISSDQLNLVNFLAPFAWRYRSKTFGFSESSHVALRVSSHFILSHTHTT